MGAVERPTPRASPYGAGRATSPRCAGGFQAPQGEWLVGLDGASAHYVGLDGRQTHLLGPTLHSPQRAQAQLTVEALPPFANLQFGLCGGNSARYAGLGWLGGVGVRQDGVILHDGYRHGGQIDPIREGDVVTLLICRGRAFLRKEPTGLWNGRRHADPDAGRGGILLDCAGDICPIILTNAPGVQVRGDFSRWSVLAAATFDASPAKSSLAWALSEDRCSATHACVTDTPATVLGLAGYESGDRQVTFTLDVLPAASLVQAGLCDSVHLIDNALGWAHSLGLAHDGKVRGGGAAVLADIGPWGQGDSVTVRLCGAGAFFRREPDGLWNGRADAWPERGIGALPLDMTGPIFPAVYAERPGVRVTGEFSKWVWPIGEAVEFEALVPAAGANRPRRDANELRPSGRFPKEWCNDGG